ncbi:hypothetical protein [Amycolatopsis albispora]|uniref:Head-tail adaptor protein n=1 Tax=Amycolatopsis albispora TaxID=1804986 RepID=A0A344LGY4_9PSEU|nr:hypothetical protein [Amycolatopsis albispora]AXB47308.1 hypothetical protein A4R43_36685 [Amycolatopsis albispora]
MRALATCRASLFRGYTTDPHTGDEMPSTEPVGTPFPAAIDERESRVWDSSTQTPRVVRVIRCTVPSTLEVEIGDRLRDDTNGETFTVQLVTRPRAPAGHRPETVLELRRVG